MSASTSTRRAAAISIGLFLLSIAELASAEALPPPNGRVILSITGKIGQFNRGKEMVFDMALLETLPQHSFTTRTPWYDRPIKFTGPLLTDVLAIAKAQGSIVKATAINDYTIKIPVADAQEHGVIVARLLDDQPMAVRDRGPLFVIYPFDSKTELRSSTYYERSIWQLKRMSIE